MRASTFRTVGWSAIRPEILSVTQLSIGNNTQNAQGWDPVVKIAYETCMPSVDGGITEDMSHSTQPTHAPLLQRLLDGGHTWGSLTVSPPRYGVSRYRLVVFPPGLSPEDRMLLRAWRTWPMWGVAVFLGLEILLPPVLGPGPALWLAAAVSLGAGAALMAMTGAHRREVHAMSVVRTACADDAQVAARYADLHAMADELAVADRKLAEGQIGAVEHELAVWGVYDRMADAHH